jgi:hypothetical protein
MWRWIRGSDQNSIDFSGLEPDSGDVRVTVVAILGQMMKISALRLSNSNSNNRQLAQVLCDVIERSG